MKKEAAYKEVKKDNTNLRKKNKEQSKTIEELQEKY